MRYSNIVTCANDFSQVLRTIFFCYRPEKSHYQNKLGKMDQHKAASLCTTMYPDLSVIQRVQHSGQEYRLWKNCLVKILALPLTNCVTYFLELFMKNCWFSVNVWWNSALKPGLGLLFVGRVLVPYLVSSLVILFVLSSFLESVSGVCVFLRKTVFG